MVAGFLGRVARRILENRPADVSPAAQPPEGLAHAVALHQSGRLDEARAGYLAAIAQTDRNPVALCMLGVLSHQQGDSDAAVTWIRRALDIDPAYLFARSNLGLVYLSLGRLELAEAELRRAIELDASFGNAHANLGLVLRERGDVEGAEEALTRAVALNPSNVEAWNNLGSVCRDQGKLDAAESHYRQALALRPNSVTILQNLGAVAIGRGDWIAAVNSYRAATEADASDASAWSSLGYALGQAGQLADAEAACRHALALRPDWPDALVNLADVLKRQHDLDAAEASCRRAIAIDPAHAPAHVNLGLIRQERDDVPAAEACYRRAVALDPKLPSARYGLGAVLLLRGQYEEGFALVESRFQAFPRSYAAGVRGSLAADAGRRWTGEPLAGRRLLVWSEQGFGDSLMMLRFLPLLKSSGASAVALSCERELRRIAERIPGVDAITDAESQDALPQFDAHCPMMSLPFCFRIGRESVPSATPYIVVPPAAQAQWAARMPRREGLRVGVAWAGSPTLRDDAQRSVRAADLALLCGVPGVQWVSLQKGPAAAQIVQWKSPILDFMAECEDFQDTAALIANLDLVISVDTAVIHLAGALGKPVWLLNRAGSEWRWGLAGERSPWYPSLRIFRQRQSLEWAPLIEEVAIELERIQIKDSA